jgi:hypothetical protein
MIKENGPRYEGILFGSKRRVVAMAVWPLCSDEVRQHGWCGAPLVGVDKWYNNWVGVFALGQGSFLVG